MRRSTLILLTFALLAVGVFGVDYWQDRRDLHVTLINPNGREIGEVKLTPMRNDTTLMFISVRGLTPGFHGFHIHEHGRCEVTRAGNFITAGAHFDMTGHSHGQHSGDLPILLADENGYAMLIFHTASFTLRDLLADNGTAIIIHAEADNFANIPVRYGGADETTRANGDAGARIACGVIRRD